MLLFAQNMPMQQPQYLDSISASAKLGMELVMLGKVIRRELSREAARLGISDGEWGVLVHLRRSGGGISQQDLAWRLGNKPHAVVRVLTNLEKAGSITRLVDPNDARGRLVSLTASGRKLADRLLRLIDEFERDLVSHLPQAEITRLVASMRTMRETLAKERPD